MGWDDLRRLVARAQGLLRLSESDLAARVGWAASTAGAFEAGECVPTPAVTVALWRVVVEAQASMN